MRTAVTDAPTIPAFEEIERAAERIAPHVHRTPVLTSTTLNRELGAEVFCKCENLQKIGAFKARGAVNAVLSLPRDRAAAGVVAHSSGNHAAALAYAASIRGIPCTVVMPRNASPVKLEAVRGYGARIVLCDPSQREEATLQIQRESGAVLVHPFEDPDVIAGQGTAALELLDEIPDLDILVTPVGGGGLCAGTALATAGRGKETAVWAAEPEAVDDTYRSLQSGVRQPRVSDPKTWADGLLTQIGRPNFEILRRYDVRVLLVGEEEMLVAAHWFLERMKIVVEPSAATVLGALRRVADEIAGTRVGLVLSGGNTDFSWLRALPERGER